jgi:hypothetical protein
MCSNGNGMDRQEVAAANARMVESSRPLDSQNAKPESALTAEQIVAVLSASMRAVL